MKNEDYVFYFDECYQDRKILIKDTAFNSMSDNSFDSYIGLFWGCKQKELHRIVPLINNFEQKYMSIFGLSKDQELKSDIIKKKNYMHGLKSFNKNATGFYSDLFCLLEEINPIIQIDAMSKVEIFLTALFENIKIEHFISVDRKAFIYSLTKLILTYEDTAVMTSIKNVSDNITAESFRTELLTFITKKLNEVEGIDRKAREENVLKEFIIVLSSVTFDNMEYEERLYPYFTNFTGLNNLLQELSIPISKVKITIDEELNTYNSSKLFNYKIVKQANSKNSIQIRLCDWLCGFIGRFTYALFNDIGAKELNGDNIEKKRLLSEEWFNIDNKTFNFYQVINRFFNINHAHYWTTMTLSYADPIVELFTLLRYFGSFDSYEEYKSKKLYMHQELYNAACVDELENRYNTLH